MKVFISWSGKRSKALAQALREWLPLVLQHIEPWVSENDIAAGDRWAQTVGAELEASNFGIICITPENLASPWVLFEAGALSKSMQDAKVIPLLFDLEFSDITDPLSQFQAKKVDQTGITEMIQAINNASENKASNDIVKQLVPALWTKLESLLGDIPEPEDSEENRRSQHEVLEELVTGVRGLDSRFRELDMEMSERSPISRHRKYRRFHPVMFEEFTHMVSDDEDDPISLLMMAGLIRDDFPWLSEVIVETYRDIKNGKAKDAEKAVYRLRRTTKMMRKGPFMEEFMGGSKEAHMMAMELPHFLDRALRRYIKDQNPDSDDDN